MTVLLGLILMLIVMSGLDELLWSGTCEEQPPRVPPRQGVPRPGGPR